MATELGRRVYDLVKAGALSWSIGFTVPDSGRRRAGKVTELTEIDLVEVSAVATPANADARTLSIKRYDRYATVREQARDQLLAVLRFEDSPDHASPSNAELKARSLALAKELGLEHRPR